MSSALVIGLGRMGTFHAKVLADLGYDVTTVDPDPARQATYPAPPLGHYPIVAIATPITALATTTKRAVIHHRPTYLLVEKPFAASTTQAAAVIPVLLDVPHVAVGYTERFNPQVRRLRDFLVRRDTSALNATFVRHNERPTSSINLDLRAHDIDLAHHLELAKVAAYDTRAHQPRTTRRIDLTIADEESVASIDLTAHSTSPLHAMWHTFLSNRDGYATPIDALRILEHIEHEHTTPALAA